MGVQTFTAFLFKDTVRSFADALDSTKTTDQYSLVPELGVTGTLYVGAQHQSTPSWVGRLNPFLQPPIGRALNANISAVLLFEVEQRILAFTFGHGKSLLEETKLVRDFGLKVTLNRVDESKLRSVDAKTYEDLVRSTRTQTSRSSNLESFQIDVARDLVRGVTGKARDTTFFKKLTGSTALNFSTPIPFNDISDLLEELIAAYKDTAYQKHFSWIDNVKEVDPLIAHQLDMKLVDALKSGDLDGMHLAPADVVDWQKTDGFNFTRGDKHGYFPELDLQHYLEVLDSKLSGLTLEDLCRHKVRVRYEDTEEVKDMWSVYECLVWETDHLGTKYVLFDGRWFEISTDYAAQVTNHVNGLVVDPISLPDAKKGVDEGEYNEAVAQAEAARFACLDSDLIRPTGAPTPIEFCDLLDVSGAIIHVKKRSHSSTLSHLFAQGSVSCDVFLRDEGARKLLKEKLRKLKKLEHANLFSKDRPTPSSFRVVFIILAPPRKTWPPRVPFFSAVNLVHHSNRIQDQGFKVTLQHVKIV